MGYTLSMALTKGAKWHTGACYEGEVCGYLKEIRGPEKQFARARIADPLGLGALSAFVPN